MFKYLVVLGLVAVASTAERRAVVTITGNDAQSTAKGLVYFTEVAAGGVLVNGTVTGLTPGLHGFHVHQFGDVSGACATTGSHFNPTNATHGARNATQRHVGDLENIQADAAGVAVFAFTDTVITLSGANNIIGRGVVVHQDPDDLGLGGFEDSTTTGHAGARVGCGIIGTLDETNPADPPAPGGATSLALSSALAVLIAAIHRRF